MIDWLGNMQARQLTELYRALRLYVNCFQPSMKLLAKERDGKKVRCVYDAAKTPFQRLLLSGILPPQKQQGLTEVEKALDPIRLMQQLEQLQQAVFRCAASGSPVLAPIPSHSISVFTVDVCMLVTLPQGRNAPDPTAGLKTLYHEQERRKRVLGWRRTHKDPFEGEWEQILSWLVANPERAQWRYLSGVAAPFTRSLSAITNPHPAAGDAENPSLPGTKTVQDGWQEEVIRGPSPSGVPEGCSTEKS